MQNVPTMDFSSCFFIIRFSLSNFGNNTTEVCSSQCIASGLDVRMPIIGDLQFDHFIKAVYARFIHYFLLFVIIKSSMG